MTEWVFTIPETPLSVNELARGKSVGWQRKKYAEHRDRWTWLFKQQFMLADAPVADCKREVRITFYFDRPARRDPDNFLSKGIRDALVIAGWLRDDSSRGALFHPARCIYDLKRGPATVVEIKDMEPRRTR